MSFKTVLTSLVAHQLDQILAIQLARLSATLVFQSARLPLRGWMRVGWCRLAARGPKEGPMLRAGTATGATCATTAARQCGGLSGLPEAHRAALVADAQAAVVEGVSNFSKIDAAAWLRLLSVEEVALTVVLTDYVH